MLIFSHLKSTWYGSIMLRKGNIDEITVNEVDKDGIEVGGDITLVWDKQGLAVVCPVDAIPTLTLIMPILKRLKNEDTPATAIGLLLQYGVVDATVRNPPTFDPTQPPLDLNRSTADVADTGGVQ